MVPSRTAYTLFNAAVLFWIPFVLLVFCYVSILKAVFDVFRCVMGWGGGVCCSFDDRPHTAVMMVTS